MVEKIPGFSMIPIKWQKEKHTCEFLVPNSSLNSPLFMSNHQEGMHWVQYHLQVLEGSPLLYWDLVLDLLLVEKLLALLPNCNPYHYAMLDAPAHYTSISNRTIPINFTFIILPSHFKNCKVRASFMHTSLASTRNSLSAGRHKLFKGKGKVLQNGCLPQTVDILQETNILKGHCPNLPKIHNKSWKLSLL